MGSMGSKQFTAITSRRTWLRWLFAPLLAVALAACGGGSSSNSQSNLRLVNATKSSAVTVTLNGGVTFASITASNISGYTGVGAGAYTVTVTSDNGSLTSATQTVTLGGSQNYSLLVYESQGALRMAPINETQATPIAGYGSMAASNVSSDPGPLDIYVVPAGTTTLTGLSPTLANISGTSLFSTMPAGTYDVYVTAQGNRSDVRLALTSVTVTSGQTQVLALLESVGALLGLALENARLERANLRAALADERQAIAADVHDSIGQSLAYVKMRLPLLQDAIRGCDQAGAEGYFDDVRGAVREAHAQFHTCAAGVVRKSTGMAPAEARPGEAGPA